jgi:hypothetical protein
VLPAECRRGLRSSAECNGTPPSASLRAPPRTETSVAKGDYATCCRAPPRCRGRWQPPSAAECHRAPQIAAEPRAVEHGRAAAGAERRRAPLFATEHRRALPRRMLPSAATPPRALRTAEHYGAQPSKTEKWARRYVRDRAVVAQQRAHAPRLTPPPASPPLISHRSLQVRDTEGRGGVTTEVVSRYGSRPACNPRRQGGTTSGPTSATEEVIHPWVGLGS